MNPNDMNYTLSSGTDNAYETTGNSVAFAASSWSVNHGGSILDRVVNSQDSDWNMVEYLCIRGGGAGSVIQPYSYIQLQYITIIGLLLWHLGLLHNDTQKPWSWIKN